MAKAMKSESFLHDLHILGHTAGSFQMAWKATELPRNFPGSSSREILVLLVNDSEYSKSAGAKPILSPGGIYLVFSGAREELTPRQSLVS
jgi:hypothetical protein